MMERKSSSRMFWTTISIPNTKWIHPIDEWRPPRASEFLRKKDRENVDSELVETLPSLSFGERAHKIQEQVPEGSGRGQILQYDEGAMRFDSPKRPSRTVVTDEIGRTPSRMRHIIEYEEGMVQGLSPEETQVLNGFPAGSRTSRGSTWVPDG